MGKGILFKYRPLLPITQNTPIITLGEGDTPLVRSLKLEKEIGGEIYFKLEGCNPTGSFKDRGMVMAIAKALEEKSKAIICASTGNTSASAAAYGSRFGLKTIIIVPGEKITTSKFAQAIAYGAQIISIQGNFDQAFQIARYLAQKYPVTLVNSLNPFRLEGQKTAAFEIVDELGDAPDFLFIPVGNAGNITAYWSGFKEYHKLGKANKTPKMMGFQAEGAAPIVRGEVITMPKTIASAICVGNPVHWKKAIEARDESGGIIDAVSDEEIISAYKFLASKEGIFGEPSSAVGVAGLIKLARMGMDFKGKRIVCVITGIGLKDVDTALGLAPPFPQLPPDPLAVEKALGL